MSVERAEICCSFIEDLQLTCMWFLEGGAELVPPAHLLSASGLINSWIMLRSDQMHVVSHKRIQRFKLDASVL